MKRNEKYFKGLTRRDYIAKANEIIHREGISAVTIRRIAKEMECSTALCGAWGAELLYPASERGGEALEKCVGYLCWGMVLLFHGGIPEA